MKQSEIEKLLPGVFQRTIQPGTPIFGILAAMESLHAPTEDALESLADYFNPYKTPDRFVPMLARWVDLDRFLSVTPAELDAGTPTVFPSGLGWLRELVVHATTLSKWRGTSRGLLQFLETATGVKGFTVQEQVLGPEGRIRPFHILVQAPREADRFGLLVRRIIEMEKPAYVTYDLEVVDRPSDGLPTS